MSYSVVSRPRSDLLQRITNILAERYEPFAAERVALRILEAIQPGDRLGPDLVALPAGQETSRYATDN